MNDPSSPGGCLLVLGAMMLLPGLCSLLFALDYIERLFHGAPPDTYGGAPQTNLGFWLCLAIGVGGIFLIYRPLREWWKRLPRM